MKAIYMACTVMCLFGLMGSAGSETTQGDVAIREVIQSTLKDGVERELVRASGVLAAVEFGVTATGLHLNDGGSVDKIVRVLESVCRTMGVFTQLSTLANTKDHERIIVSCSTVGPEGYWNVKSSGRLVAVKFVHTPTTPALLEYYILDEAPGGVLYSWPRYGVFTTSTATFNISSHIWYPQAPVTNLAPTLFIPTVLGNPDGLFYVSKPQCMDSTQSATSTPYDDATHCKRFSGVIGLESPPTDLVKYLKMLSTTTSSTLMVTTGTGLAFGTSSGYVQYPVNATGELQSIAALMTLRGWTQEELIQETNRWIYVLPFTHATVVLGSPLWVTVGMPPTTNEAATRTMKGKHLELKWQNLIKTSLSALGKLEQLFEASGLSLMSENGRDVRVTDQVVAHLVEVCRLYAGSVRAVHAAGPAGSMYYALCPAKGATAMTLGVRNPSQANKNLLLYSINAAQPLKAWPNYGTPTEQAYDPTTQAWWTSGLPSANPSLAVTISEPLDLLQGGKGVVLTKPRCAYNGVETEFDEPNCPRFQGLLSVELDDSALHAAVNSAELMANGHAFLVSPKRKHTDTSVTTERTVAILSNDWTARQLSGVISGDTMLIDVVDLVPAAGTLRIKAPEWKLVMVLFSGDLPATSLPSEYIKTITRAAGTFMSGVVDEGMQALDWLGSSLSDRRVNLREKSTTDDVVAAEIWACEYHPQFKSFYTSSSEGNLLQTACANTAGREVTVQNTSNAEQSVYKLDKLPGAVGTTTYVWDSYGPLAHAELWTPDSEPWYKKAQANIQSTNTQFATMVPTVVNPAPRAPVLRTDIATSVLTRPHCVDSLGQSTTSAVCDNNVGWLIGDMHLTAIETYLKSFSASGIAYVARNNKTLLAASKGPVTNVTGALEVTNSSEAEIKQVGGIRDSMTGSSTTGTVDNRAVWVERVQVTPPDLPAFEDWEVVMALYQDQYRDDFVDTLRRLIKSQINSSFKFVLETARDSLNTVKLSLDLSAVSPSTEGDTDRLLLMLWSLCDSPLPSMKYTVTSAEGENMYTCICKMYEKDSVMGRDVTVKHATSEYTYHLGSVPGVGLWWPNYGVPFSVREVNYTVLSWHTNTVPAQNPNLDAKWMPAVDLSVGQSIKLATPRCSDSGQDSRYSVPGVCDYFQGLVAIEFPITVEFNKLFQAQKGLGANGAVFAFTESGKLLAASDGSTAPDILASSVNPVLRETAEQLKIRQAWGTARKGSVLQFDSERGTEMEIAGHTANVDIVTLQAVSGTSITENIYLCLVLRLSDFTTPLETRPPRRPLHYNAATTLSPHTLLIAALLLVFCL
eukprot:TRINITY_DN3080_c2_g1_i1.p1 TRINITY_DN3080_c2_g1~~TRINITY_DN3080_c2_g1_i1.p1  ORF type:complete len:1333 (+),score=341.55 TRINITY_DN3080_c2_g1_i1:66-4001(+)